MDLNELLESKPGFTTALWDRVEAYYTDPQHEAAFRAWYKEKYGEEYKSNERAAV